MDLRVYDLASVRYAWNRDRTRLQLLGAHGEFLGAADVAAGADARAAAYAACEAALDRGRVRVDGRLWRIALYNPYSAEVSVGPAADNRIHSDQAPVAISPAGSPAHLDDDILVIVEDRPGQPDRALPVARVDLTALCATWLVRHPEPVR